MSWLTAIHPTSTIMKMVMKVQLPPNLATRSATRSPNVDWASNA